MKTKCICQDPSFFKSNYETLERDELIKVFKKIRIGCEVLKNIITDDFWAALKSKPYGCDKAFHSSIFWISYNNGYLHRLTKALHEFLYDRSNIDKRYKQALRENWLDSKTIDKNNAEVKHHQKGKAYMGKIHELMFAEYLQERGAEILNMEAWKEGLPDIIANCNNEIHYIETKYIGQDEESFKKIFLEKKAYEFTPQDIANYVLFRLCEAGAQLKRCGKEGIKTVVILLNSFVTSDHFKIAIENGFVNFDNPEFSDYEDMMRALNQDRNQETIEKNRDIIENPSKYLNWIDKAFFFNSDNFQYNQIFSWKDDVIC